MQSLQATQWSKSKQRSSKKQQDAPEPVKKDKTIVIPKPAADLTEKVSLLQTEIHDMQSQLLAHL